MSEGFDLDKFVGAAPGSRIFIGEQKVDQPKIQILEYDQEHIETFETTDPEDLRKYVKTKRITWINVIGLHDVAFIEKIGQIFDLHFLVQEDILNTNQRPKFEDYLDYLFLTGKLLRHKDEKISSAQVSMVIGKNFLITFVEEPSQFYVNVRYRLMKPTTRIRYRKSDYLAYALLNDVVDNYIKAIEMLGDQVVSSEEQLLDDPSQDIVTEIYNHKRKLNDVKKAVWPAGNLIEQYYKCDSDILSEETMPYLRDLVDHCNMVNESVDSLQSMLVDQLSTYNTSVNNRLNDIMKLLTIYSVIFIPMSFLAGVYGMNWEVFPELSWKYGYLIFWGIIISLAVSMVIYFKRKGWI